ncbi:MAG: YggS family pyridoxal phosphate-dependent enzyme [Proteobacteria bacterium]|nr:YggS family pyridoxal phosphate-dependent enzyme [Pseudomonadota bacterium]
MDQRSSELRENLESIRAEMDSAAVRTGRKTSDVRLLAVSKFHATQDVERLVRLGQTIFGESYVQEALDKQDALTDKGIEWHYIGGLQSNKARFVAGKFRLVHSVDSPKLARLLHKYARAADTVQDILLQVSLAGELQKSGIVEDQLPGLLEEAQGLDGIRVVGFMTMPPFFDEPEVARPYFCRLRELRDRMEIRFGEKYPELSMGMTGDFVPAIEEGATLVRIGTRLFGPRQYTK